MGHPYTITQVCMCNTKSCVVSNDKIKQQRSRIINMRYFWIRDQNILKTLSLHEKQDKKILQTILRSIIIQSVINLYVLYTYTQIKCHGQSRSYYLSRTWKGMLIQRIPRWNNSARLYPFPEYHDSVEIDPGHRPRIDGP